jgi:hypothetical protein
MTPDEQHFLSVRYRFSPLLLVPLPSGEWAIAEGFNPFPLIELCSEEALPAAIRRLTDDQAARHRARAKTPPPSVTLDLSDLTLDL